MARTGVGYTVCGDLGEGTIKAEDIRPGREQYIRFWSATLRLWRIQYDYRTPEGELFSCVAKTLNAARRRRDYWLAKRSDKI